MTTDPPFAVNRRSFLAAAASACAAPSLLSADEKGDGNLIDAHSHIWPPDDKKYPLAPGQTVADLQPASFTAPELLALCRPHGVQRVVLIQHTIYHRFDNSYIVDAIAQYPGTFSAVAVIDDKALRPQEEVLRLRKKGVRGFRIVPRDWHGGGGAVEPDQWLQGEGMRAMWKAAGENGMAMCPLINPEYLPSVNAMCAAFPDTNVVIDHFARIGTDGTIRDSDLNNLCALAKHKHAHVKISAYYALGKKQPPYKDLIPMIERVVDAFGPERAMWASDAPYQVVAPHTYEASINLIKNGIASLSDADRDWLLRRTAEKVFFSA